MKEFTHLDKDGRVRMVDVTEKASTHREALAEGRIFMSSDTLARILDQRVAKGNVLETARIAGIMAAKRTAELIPMCHPLSVTHISVDFHAEEKRDAIRIEASVRVQGPTGVEIEALTAVSVAALTVYDMCKSYDRQMVISDICLLKKSGGKSGTFIRGRASRSSKAGE